MPTPARTAHLETLRAHIDRLGAGLPELAFPARQAMAELAATIASPARDEACATHLAHLKNRFTGQYLSLPWDALPYDSAENSRLRAKSPLDLRHRPAPTLRPVPRTKAPQTLAQQAPAPQTPALPGRLPHPRPHDLQRPRDRLLDP